MSTAQRLREAMAKLDEAVDFEDNKLIKAAIRGARQQAELALADVLRRDDETQPAECTACNRRASA